MDGAHLGRSMSGWRRLLEEESEHQWLSFAVFAILVIGGAILIDWSNELSGVHQGGQINADGVIFDSAGDAVMYQTDEGMRISINDVDNLEKTATCLEEFQGIIFACLGEKGSIAFMQEDNIDCESDWCDFSIGQDTTAKDVSVNGYDMLMIIQEGTSDSLAALNIDESYSQQDYINFTAQHEGKMHLETMIATDDGWLVGGSWQAPANWLASNPVSPPMFELVLSVEWDGKNSPAIEIIHMGDEGQIHGIFATSDGHIATGSADTISIIDGEVTSLGVSSYASVVDSNKDVWLFGQIGSTSVAVISDGEIDVEKLSEPLSLDPTYIYCDNEGMISIHGTDSSDEPSAISIDSNARSSFMSLRGIMDLGFILISIIIMSIMGWNIADAIRKGEVF